MPSNDELLRFAIAHRRLLAFEYHGAPRAVEPHDYGVLNGREALLAYQVGGRSQGRLPGWRQFDVDGLTHVAVLDDTFPGSRAQAGQAHKQWDTLYCRVE